ncbi:MAG: hypothetical protein RBT59_10440 [Arcobacteraceae bacterium]|jgi:hypothetical protein|nr:hypothetical protein [Arcobacteraceae bacterium]
MTKKEKKIQTLKNQKANLIKKVREEDKKVIQNFHMIKLSTILEIKQNIRYLSEQIDSKSRRIRSLYDY